MKELRQHEKRNFAVFAVNQILMRIGWVFKTESVVVPGFLDNYTTSDVLRGFLPVSLRLGQSLPQFLIAQYVTQIPYKQPLFTISAFGIMVPWLVLALILRGTQWSSSVVVCLFLTLYTVHWFTFGCHLLATGTLQGKLIRAERRGLLLAYANSVGGILAIGAAALLMYQWLGSETPRYSAVFGATAICFGLAAIASLYFREPPSLPQQPQPFFKFLGAGLLLLRSDRDFRKFALVIVLFFSSWPLFPHYTVFGKRVLGLESSHFVTWIIVQYSAAALGSWVIGAIADRRGNRIALRILVLLSSCTPLVAVGISRVPFGANLYWLIYAFLGLTPVIHRIIGNYTLEISPEEKQPQYLGVVSLLESCPLLVSPLVGLLISRVSFEPVFLGGSALIITSGLLTFRLVEPRLNRAS